MIHKQEIQKILNTLNEYYGFNILTKTKKREYFFARCIFFKLARVYTKCKLKDLSKISKITHASIIHSINVFDYDIKHDTVIAQDYKNIITLYCDLFTNTPETILEKQALLKRENARLKLEIVNLQNVTKENVFNHDCIGLLNSLPYDLINTFNETRVKPFLKMNKL